MTSTHDTVRLDTPLETLSEPPVKGPVELHVDGPTGQATFDPRRWAALAVIMTAAFMDLVDVTIVNVGLPVIQRDLGSSMAGIQWITAAYSLAFGAGLISGGRLGDIYGRKRLFLLGIASFTFASLLCGLSPGTEPLIAARALQGAGAALMVPQVLSIINVSFPAEERPKVFGLYGAMVGLATVTGPLLGALLTNWDLAGLGWRPIFLVNIPVGIAGLLLGARLIRETRSDVSLRLDPLGVVLIMAALGLVMYPLTMGGDAGWPAWTFASMALGLALVVAFVGWERRLATRGGSPLMDPSLFSVRSFAGGVGVQFFFSIAMGIFFLVWTVYLQVGLGWSVLHAGLTAAPYSAAVGAGAGVAAGALVPKFGRSVIRVGALLMGAGALAYGVAARVWGADITSWHMLPVLVLTGIGMGMVLSPLTDATLAEVPSRDAGSASGLLSTMTQVGWAIGLGLVSISFFGPAKSAFEGLRHAPTPSDMTTIYVDAFCSSLWWVAGALVIAALCVFALPRTLAGDNVAG